MPPTLVLVRHGQSEGNDANIFTGWRDVGLTERGVAEARAAGKRLAECGIRPRVGFTSALERARRTLAIIEGELGNGPIPTTVDPALNERDYGKLTGLNKEAARARFGEERIREWRRSYDVAPPGGESLRDTGARVWPFYINRIQPHVLRGETVIVAAHGNSLRALAMALEGMTGEEIVAREISTGVPVVYRLNDDSSVLSSELLSIDVCESPCR